MRARRAFGIAATTLLVVAAMALACWLVFSAVTGATLITFRTGSMAPTMPQGSVAVSVPVQAEEIAVGDVVTVRRPADGLPVTHRVVEVRDDAHAESILDSGQRELILKGDDNEVVDHQPYVVSEARRVLFAVPGAGAAIMLMQSPLGMGVLVLFAASLTVWAVWPRRHVRSEAGS